MKSESLMNHLHSIGAHELGQVLTEAALSKVSMWVEMLHGRFFSEKGLRDQWHYFFLI